MSERNVNAKGRNFNAISMQLDVVYWALTNGAEQSQQYVSLTSPTLRKIRFIKRITARQLQFFSQKVASLCIQMPPLSCVALPPTWSEKVLLLLLVQRVQAISKCEMSGVKNTLQIIRRHCFRAAFAQSAHKAFASICSLWWQFLQNKLVRKTLKNFAVALLYR